MAPSKDYLKALEQAKLVHREYDCYSGKFLRPHANEIKNIIERLGIKSILDYGCGKGKQYLWANDDGETLEELWGVKVTKYDPAVPEFEADPQGKFDLVICTHVLGCIPEQDLPWVVTRIFGYANKAVYIAEGISDTPAKAKKGGGLPPCPLGRSALDWIDLLSPYKPEGVELHVAIRYRMPDRTVFGRFFIK